MVKLRLIRILWTLILGWNLEQRLLQPFARISRSFMTAVCGQYGGTWINGEVRGRDDVQ